jgi:hypothetical protein
MSEDSPVGVVAVPDAPTSAPPTAEGRFRYRLYDCEGKEIAAVECEQVLDQDDVLQLDGRPWRVVTTIGCAARVTRVKPRSRLPAPAMPLTVRA